MSTARKRAPIEAPTPIVPPTTPTPEAVAAAAAVEPPAAQTREQLLDKCRAAQRRARYGHRIAAQASDGAPKRAKDIEKVVNSLKTSKDPATKEAMAAMARSFIEECNCDIDKFCGKYNIKPDAVPAIRQISDLLKSGMPLTEALATVGSMAAGDQDTPRP